MKPAVGPYTRPRGRERLPWLAAQGARERRSHSARETLKALGPPDCYSTAAAQAVLALPAVPGDTMARWRARRRLEEH